MRHLFLVIALFGAGLLPARGADSPARMISGKRSIQELLNIPGYHDGKPVPMQFVQPMLWWY